VSDRYICIVTQAGGKRNRKITDNRKNHGIGKAGMEQHFFCKEMKGENGYGRIR
jgi:hypothetical protein